MATRGVNKELTFYGERISTIGVMPVDANHYREKPSWPKSSVPDPILSDRTRIDLADLGLDAVIARSFSAKDISASVTSESQSALQLKLKNLSAKLWLGDGGIAPSMTFPTYFDQDFTLGPQAIEVADAIGVEAMLFLYFSGWQRAAASSTQLGSQATAAGNLLVALIDGETGNLLWYGGAWNYQTPPFTIEFNKERLEKMLDTALSSLELRRK